MEDSDYLFTKLIDIKFILVHIAILCIYKGIYRIIDKDFIKQVKPLSIAALGGIIFLAVDETNTDLGVKIIWTLFATVIIWQWAQASLKIESRKFKSGPKENSINAFYLPPPCKKTKEFSDNDIPFYVRFTLYEIKSGTKDYGPIREENKIFDSSDYSEINEQFGTFDGYKKLFEVGNSFELNNISYVIDSVRVDVNSIFNDYSDGLIYNGHGKPYNIQVIVDLKRK